MRRRTSHLPTPFRTRIVVFAFAAALPASPWCLRAQQAGVPAAAARPAADSIAADTPAAPGAALRTLAPADYGRWERLGFATLSPRGRWLAVPISRTNEENELRIRRVGTDSVVVVAHGQNGVFSKDGRWAAYEIGVSEAERKKLEKAKKPVHGDAGLLDLERGDTVLIPDAGRVAFSGDGHYAAVQRHPAEGEHGSDLLVRDLTTKRDLHFGHVASFEWADHGALLAMVVDDADATGRGVQLYDAGTGTLRPLDSGAAGYGDLAWRKDHPDLAVLKAVADSGWADSAHVVLAWRDVARSDRRARVFDPAGASGFPAGLRIVDFRPLRWAKDGSALFFGIKAREAKEEPEARAAEADSAGARTGAAKEGAATGAGKADAASQTKGGPAADEGEEKPAVEIWHAKDREIIPEQKARNARYRERNDLAAWNLDDGAFVRLGNGPDEDVRLSANDRTAVVLDRAPYLESAMFGPAYEDVYVADLATGARTKALEKVQYFRGVSPDGRYLLYVDGGDYWSYDVRSGARLDLTGKLGTPFVDVEDDHTIAEKPPYGDGGWLKGDRAVLLDSKYDVWRVAPDGSGAERLTDGAADSVRYRVVTLDPEADAIDPSQPIYYWTYGEWSKKYGYARARPGEKPRRLVWADENVSRLLKAKDADVYGYTAEDFDDSPDYFVGGPDLRGASQVTHTNPFQTEYAWGRSELVEFRNAEGRRLQGSLYYPAGYQPGKKYPMIVYIYEIRSPSVHNYSEPSERSYYNFTDFTQEGYFVFQPDIVYRDRNPGLSAVDAIVPAVKTVLQRGDIDPQRVGLIGHSWGGYQTAFTVTQTDVFAAAVAGAPLTDLYSMYLSVYWNSGSTDARIFEISQGRMEVPFWKDLDAYRANSPVFNIEKLNTPLLVEDGTKDGAVDFNQAVEFYNAARRAKKDLVLLVYNGENHGLSKKPDQIDYHRRIMAWFAHYLKGEPAPDWITDGLPYLVQEKRFKKGDAGSPRR